MVFKPHWYITCLVSNKDSPKVDDVLDTLTLLHQVLHAMQVKWTAFIASQ